MHSHRDKEFINTSLNRINHFQEELDKGKDMSQYSKHKEEIDQLADYHHKRSTDNPVILDHFMKVSGPLGSGQIKAHYSEKGLKQDSDDLRLGEVVGVQGDYGGSIVNPSYGFMQKEGDDDGLKLYEKFVDNDGETVKDFRSDYQMHKDDQQDPNLKKLFDFPPYIFQVKQGDSTKLKIIKNALKFKCIEIAENQMEKWRTDLPELRDKIDKELLELKKHDEYPVKEKDVLEEFKVITESAIKIANWEIAFLQKFIKMFDNSSGSFFQYVSIAQMTDLENDTAENIPSQFEVNNSPLTKDESEDSIFKLTSPDTIELQSDPQLTDDSGMATWLVTKQHRTFDGSLHFTFKFPNIESGEPIFGTFFRQSDPFINQAIKFNMKKKTITVSRNNPQAFKMVFMEKIEYLSMDVYIRVVILFIQNKIKILIYPEETRYTTSVDIDAREDELSQTNHLYPPYEFFDAGMKDGRIGWFGSNCKGLLITRAVFYADACKAAGDIGAGVGESVFDYLISPISVRYTEDFKLDTKNKQDKWNCEGCKTEWIFKEVKGKLKGLENTKKVVNTVQMKSPATFVQQKDRKLIQISSQKLKASIKFTQVESGSIHLGFRVKSAQNQLGFAIHVNKNKGTQNYQVYHMNQGKQEEIVEEEFKIPFDGMNWQKIEVQVIDSTLYVMLNGKNLLIELSNPVFEDKEGGTAGFGCNAAICSFAEISMTIVQPDAFMKFIAMIRVTTKSKQTKTLADIEEEVAISQEEKASNTVDKPEEEVMLYEPCLINSNKITRKSSCVNDLFLDNADCYLDYCNICCTMMTGGKYEECKRTCLENSETAIPPSDQWTECQNVSEEQQKPEEINKCQICCEQLNNVQIPFDLFESAKLECRNKFVKCDDELNCGESMANS